MNMLLTAVIQVILFSIVPFTWWLLTARKKEAFFRWIGLKKLKLQGSLKKLIMIIITSISGYMIMMFFIMTQLMSNVETATSQFSKQGWHILPSILIYAILQTGLSEELFFRGFLGKRLIHQFGFVVGNTIQALIFGLIHGIPFGLITGNFLVTLLLTILPAILGWIEGWINEKWCSGSIIPSWIIHALMNILSALSTAL